MKVDLENWQQLTNRNDTVSGRLQLKLTEPSKVLAKNAETGQVSFIGYGTEFNVRFDGTWQIGTDVEAYIYVPPSTTVEADAEIFTNADMQPQDSGSVQFVKQGLRLLELQKREMMKEFRAAQRALTADDEQEEPNKKRRKRRDETEEENTEENSENPEEENSEETAENHEENA
jgi:hypothetical protein